MLSQRHLRLLLASLAVTAACVSFFQLGRHSGPVHAQDAFAGWGPSTRDLGARSGALAKLDKTLFHKGPRVKTHVSTDKPVYRPGDTVYVRGVVLDAADLAPVGVNEHGTASPLHSANVVVKGPKGDVVHRGNAPL